MNACTSQIIQQVFLTYMQSKQDMPMLGKVDNALDNFRPYEAEELTPEA